MKAISLFFAAVLLSMACVAGADDFLISYWWGPPITPETARLISAANFNVAQFGGKTADDNRSQLDVCAANGLKGMVLVDGDRLMAKPYTDPGFAEGIASVVSDYGQHSALWGYFLQDEPSTPAQIRQLAAVNEALKVRDRDHVPFINLLPIQTWKPYEANVESYLRTVRPRLLSFDKYPLLKGGESPDFYANLEVIRREALKYGIPFNAIALVTPHGAYRDPSEADIRWEVNSALAYGAHGIMYFTCSTPPADSLDYAGWGEGLISRDGRPTRKYQWVQAINEDVKNLAPTLLTLQSIGIYHTPPVPDGCSPLPDGGVILAVTGGQFVVGQFRGEGNSTYLMVVNRDPRNAAFANIVFQRPVRVTRIDPRTGDERPLPVMRAGGHTVWKTVFDPGEGRLIKLR